MVIIERRENGNEHTAMLGRQTRPITIHGRGTVIGHHVQIVQPVTVVIDDVEVASSAPLHHLGPDRCTLRNDIIAALYVDRLSTPPLIL